MRRTSPVLASVAALWMLFPLMAHAGRFELINDNDTAGLVPGAATTDRDYTEGARLTWVGQSEEVPAWVRQAARHLPAFGLARGAEPEGGRRFGFAIAQEIYTPDAISKTQAIPDDRPYAGWLYASLFDVAQGDRRQSTRELRIGTTGPRSLAADAQTWWHEQLAIRRPRGWSHQLGNEIGLMMRAEERWRVLGAGQYGDVIPHLGVAVGNVKTEAWAGLTLRAGLPLPHDFGPSQLEPPAASRGVHLYAFARAEGRFVARDLFLDGNTFQRSAHVTRQPLIAETQMGAGAQWGRTGLRYLFSFTTPTFRERPTSHEYGSVGISF